MDRDPAQRISTIGMKSRRSAAYDMACQEFSLTDRHEHLRRPRRAPARKPGLSESRASPRSTFALDLRGARRGTLRTPKRTCADSASPVSSAHFGLQAMMSMFVASPRSRRHRARCTCPRRLARRRRQGAAADQSPRSSRTSSSGCGRRTRPARPTGRIPRCSRARARSPPPRCFGLAAIQVLPAGTDRAEDLGGTLAAAISSSGSACSPLSAVAGGRIARPGPARRRWR